MAPEAVDPGIASGFHAADQQSYLQQILRNTKASQDNEARIHKEQNQMFVDPTAFQHGAGRDLASGATPEGKLIFPSPVHLQKALDVDKAKYAEKVGLDTNEAQANQAVASGLVDDKHPAWQAVQMAAQRKPLTPEMSKHLEALGQMAGEQALGAQPVDKYGKPLAKPNLPTPGGMNGTYDEPQWVKDAKRQGHEVTTSFDKMGLPTYSVKDAPLEGNSLMAFVKANYEGRSVNDLSAAELKTARATWVKEQQKNKGEQTTINVNATNEANSPANKPASSKELATLWLPEKGEFAVNVPGLAGMSVGDIVNKYKAVDANTRGGLATVMKSQQAVDAGRQHIDEIIQAWDDAYKAGYIPNQKDATIPGAVAAKLAAWKNAITAGNDPILAKLTALGAGDLNILSAMAPPTGNRFGYSLMKYVNEKNPAVLGSQGYTYEGGRGSLLAWRKLADIKGQTQGVGALNSRPGVTEGVAPPVAPPNTAGVSGQSPFAKWNAAQQGAR